MLVQTAKTLFGFPHVQAQIIAFHSHHLGFIQRHTVNFPYEWSRIKYLSKRFSFVE